MTVIAIAIQNARQNNATNHRRPYFSLGSGIRPKTRRWGPTSFISGFEFWPMAANNKGLNTLLWSPNLKFCQYRRLRFVRIGSLSARDLQQIKLGRRMCLEFGPSMRRFFGRFQAVENNINCSLNITRIRSLETVSFELGEPKSSTGLVIEAMH
jgi:hypothetical protein